MKHTIIVFKTSWLVKRPVQELLSDHKVITSLNVYLELRLIQSMIIVREVELSLKI